MVAVTAAALSMCFAQGAQAAPADTGTARTSAAGAGWDSLGTKSVYYSSEYRTKTVKSSGGDFKACITSSTSSKALYNLYEEDAEAHDAKLVTTVKGASCWVFHDIGSYVDGDNNRAEFYIGTEDDPEMMRVHYYD